MTQPTLRLTRNQLAGFLPDHETIKQFEKFISTIQIVDDAIEDSGGASPVMTETFETVSQNLKSQAKGLFYTGTQLTQVVYVVSGGTITKTLSYSGTKLVTVILSGDTPAGISLTKTLTYSGNQVSAVAYS